MNVNGALLFGAGQRPVMLADALAVAFEGLRHFGPVGGFRLESAILLTLKRDIPRPKRIAGERSAVDLIILDTGTSHDADEDHRQGEIANHEHPSPFDANRV